MLENFVSLADMLNEEKRICMKLNELTRQDVQGVKEDLLKQKKDLQEESEYYRIRYYESKHLAKAIKRKRVEYGYGCHWCQDIVEDWRKTAKENITKVRNIEKTIQTLNFTTFDKIEDAPNYRQKLQELKDIRKQIKMALDCFDS